MAPRKRNTTQETSDDDAAGNPRPPRKTVGKKKATVEKKSKKQVSSRKGKAVRVNYKTGLGNVEYLLLCRADCYLTPRDDAFTDRRFWTQDRKSVV